MQEKIKEMARAIDELLVENPKETTKHAMNVATYLFDRGYRKQEWISVEDRLPTEQREVLAYYGFDNGDGDLGMMFTGVLTYFAYDKKPHFQHEDLRLRVTHWMPLPEPPKMKGGE
jgi:hypothetical protein